jgi:hypothetical protein
MKPRHAFTVDAISGDRPQACRQLVLQDFCLPAAAVVRLEISHT